MDRYLYQLQHPWHWLTYGQNATALGVLLATLVNVLATLVLVRTFFTVRRQAQAADRQAEAAEAQAVAARKQAEVSEQQRVAAERAAKAAEEQVLAAQAATSVSEAQRIAAEQGAMAEREHSELIRQQILASLRPVLVFVKRSDKFGNVEYFIENHGEGVALCVKTNYRGQQGLKEIFTSHDIIGPNRSVLIALDWGRFEANGAQVRYESQDGRFFATAAEAKGLELRQSSFEVDSRGGWLAQPPIKPDPKNV